jgi:hypothetical protein
MARTGCNEEKARQSSRQMRQRIGVYPTGFLRQKVAKVAFCLSVYA